MTRPVDAEIVFHAIWSAGRLHVWGEKHLEAGFDGSPQVERYVDREELRDRANGGLSIRVDDDVACRRLTVLQHVTHEGASRHGAFHGDDLVLERGDSEGQLLERVVRA